jgi:outer membrane protein assembly factor BamB
MEKLSEMPDNTEWKEKAIQQLEIFSNKNKRASAIYRLYKSAKGKEKFIHAKSLLEKFPVWSAQMGVRIPVQIKLDHHYHAEVMSDGKIVGKINPKDNGDYINLKVSGQTLIIKCKGFGKDGKTTHHITRKELTELSKPLLEIKLKRSAKWIKTCEEPLISGVTAIPDFVIANTTQGSVFSFSRANGLPIWSKKISGRAEFRSSPAFINGKIWIFDYSSGTIYSLTSQSGDIVAANSAKQIQNEGGMRSKVIFFKSTLDRDAVLFAGGAADGKMICINAVTGRTNGVVYKSDSSLPVKNMPIYLNNTVVFIDPQGKVNGIQPNGSKAFVINNSGQSSVAAIAAMKNMLFTISEDGYAKMWNNINNGNQLTQQWRSRYSIGSSPTFLAADDNYLVTIVEGNRVIGINQKNGKVIWEAPYLTSKPFIKAKLNGRVLLLWSSDILYAIDTHKRGKLIWKYRCDTNSPLGGITVDKRSIILSFEDGTIHYLDRTDYK